jgi:hypothetical protein
LLRGAHQELNPMKSTLNNACISALLCGAVFFALPSFAAGIGTGAVGGVTGSVSTPATAPVTGPVTSVPSKAGTTTDGTIERPTTAASNAGDQAVSTANNTAAADGNTAIGGGTGAGGASASADVNSRDLANHAGSANSSTQRAASHMSKKATATANKSEAETTRQLNQQQANAGANGSATVQQ